MTDSVVAVKPVQQRQFSSRNHREKTVKVVPAPPAPVKNETFKEEAEQEEERHRRHHHDHSRRGGNRHNRRRQYHNNSSAAAASTSADSGNGQLAQAANLR